MKQSERSFQFMKNYESMRNEGKGVYEIADYYHLSPSHAYRLLRKLAEQVGVPYESLLACPHDTHIVIGPAKKVEPVKRVDFSTFERDFREGLSAFDKALYQMDKVLENWPVMSEELTVDFGGEN